MSSVGAYLRGLRERQGISVDELSRATRVLSHYLEALEKDDLDSLPAPVFTKGFIRAYCQAVGSDPGEALRLYDRSGARAPEKAKIPIGAVRIASGPEVQHRQVIPEPDDYTPVAPQGPAPQGEQRDSRARGTVLISFILLVVVGAAFFALTLALQSGREGDGERNAQVALPPLPAVAEPPAASPAPAPAPADIPAPQPPVATQLAKQSPSVAPSVAAPSMPPAPSAPAAPSAPQAPQAASPAPAAATPTARGLASPYRLIARTTETTWIRVRTDDGRTSEETIPANEIREWVSNGPFVVTIGNAGGVSLELNGRSIPRLGASGAVITRLVLPSDNQ
jgi:cytoskeleton protein RodZ